MTRYHNPNTGNYQMAISPRHTDNMQSRVAVQNYVQMDQDTQIECMLDRGVYVPANDLHVTPLCDELDVGIYQRPGEYDMEWQEDHEYNYDAFELVTGQFIDTWA
jgi:hypothetical protein